MFGGGGEMEASDGGRWAVNRSRRRIPALSVVLLGLLALSVLGYTFLSRLRPVEKVAYGIMDTDVSIKAYGRNASSAIEAAIGEMRRLDGLFSAYDPNSEVFAININAGQKPVKVSHDTLYVVEKALDFASITQGAFDPTVLPVMSLWGFGQETMRVPSPQEISQALSLVDYTKVQVDRENSTVYITEKGMAIDLGGIAKGYAVDKMAEVMVSAGVNSFLINAGGNVYAGGRKPDRSNWRVAVTDPRDPEEYLGIIPAKDMAVVGSGDYQRFFTDNGVRYHHIIDPKTGYPVTGIRGTAVFLPSSTDADGLSTSLFILGPEAGALLLSKFEGAGAIYVMEDGNMVLQGIVDEFEFQ